MMREDWSSRGISSTRSRVPFLFFSSRLDATPVNTAAISVAATPTGIRCAIAPKGTVEAPLVAVTRSVFHPSAAPTLRNSSASLDFPTPCGPKITKPLHSGSASAARQRRSSASRPASGRCPTPIFFILDPSLPAARRAVPCRADKHLLSATSGRTQHTYPALPRFVIFWSMFRQNIMALPSQGPHPHLRGTTGDQRAAGRLPDPRHGLLAHLPQPLGPSRKRVGIQSARPRPLPDSAHPQSAAVRPRSQPRRQATLAPGIRLHDHGLRPELWAHLGCAPANGNNP